MATLSELATRALKELSLIVAGESADSADLSDAEDVILDLVVKLPEYGGGREMVDVETSISATAKAEQRVLCQAGSITITAPHSPRDGERFSVFPIAGGTITVTPYRRKIEDDTASLSVTANTTWAYRADLGDWVKVTALTNSSDSPYPAWCDLPLIHFTAMEIANQFEVPISPQLAAKIEASTALMSAKYSRPREVDFNSALPQSTRGPGRLWRVR